MLSKEDSQLEKYITDMRRHFHENPELSFREEKTLKTIEKELISMGLEPKWVEKGGIYADIAGSKKGKSVAVRADVDALPVTEENEAQYVSRNDGVMHACGHDAHTAMLLGLAKKLVKHRDSLKGNIRLLFQRAEESPPGGAISFIRHGVLKNMDYVIGQHVQTKFNSKTVAINYGVSMANADEFRVKIHGKGGHGSAPELGVDALYIASMYINAVQSIRSRNVASRTPAVITFGTINSGYRYNILAAHAEMTGTVRTFDINTQEFIRTRLREILKGICTAFGATFEFEYNKGYPVLINNESVAKVIESAAQEVLGKENVIHPEPEAGGEDFAYYLQKVPGAFYFLGVRNDEKGINSPQHSPTYDVDESVLIYGTEILYNAVMKLTSK